MDAEERPSRLVAALLTIPVVWAALVLGGLAGLRLQPSVAGAVLSLSIYLVLLFAWGIWTRPGRRTHLAVFLLALFLYWVASVALFIAMPTTMMTGWLDWFGAGMVIGFQTFHNVHQPTFLVAIAANLFVPVLVLGTVRGIIRGDWRR